VKRNLWALPSRKWIPEALCTIKEIFVTREKNTSDFPGGKYLVVTYVCNSSEDMEKQDSFIRRNMFLYRPVVREIGY
jgi:hypothetical protein